MNNSEFETSAKNVRFKSDSFSGGSLAARGAALMSDNKVNSVSPGAGQAVTNTSAPADTLKRPPYTRYIKVVPVGSLKRKIKHYEKKTALCKPKIGALRAELDRLDISKCTHWWLIDGSGRGTCKYYYVVYY